MTAIPLIGLLVLIACVVALAAVLKYMRRSGMNQDRCWHTITVDGIEIQVWAPVGYNLRLVRRLLIVKDDD